MILSLDEVERNASYSYPGVSERSINYFLSKEQNNGKSKKITKNIIRRSTSIIDGQCIHDSFLELLTSNNYFLKGNNKKKLCAREPPCDIVTLSYQIGFPFLSVTNLV